MGKYWADALSFLDGGVEIHLEYSGKNFALETWSQKASACILIYLITKHSDGSELEYYKTWLISNLLINCYDSLFGHTGPVA